MENGKNSIFSSQMCVKLTSFSYGCDCPALCLFLPCPLPWLCGGCAVPAGWSHPAQTRRASPGLGACSVCPDMSHFNEHTFTTAAPQCPSGSSGTGLCLPSPPPGSLPTLSPEQGTCLGQLWGARWCLLAGTSVFALPVSGRLPA